jgi:DNA-binding response OmpR family regulator
MKNILLIEQDQGFARNLCIRLKARGYATWVASDAISTVSLAVAQEFDLIVLDNSLIAGNALLLAKRLKELRETRETPIVLTTDATEHALTQQALEIGVAAILEKPYDVLKLLTAIRHLPRAYADRADSPVQLRNAAPHTAGPARKKVLLVEDDDKLAMALALRFRAAGFDTTIAADGMDGVRTAVRARPDVIVLDISLPAGDGFTVAQRIHAAIPTPIPMIFLTASRRQDLRQKAFQLGAVAFFEKPYPPEALVEAIEHAAA